MKRIQRWIIVVFTGLLSGMAFRLFFGKDALILLASVAAALFAMLELYQKEKEVEVTE